ncbi:hypothetical protein D8I24_7984 [Cupriavidus necator H850]|nr:hypothetical protein D8I24_7984 [Cupriavidus necator H850]
MTVLCRQRFPSRLTSVPGVSTNDIEQNGNWPAPLASGLRCGLE